MGNVEKRYIRECIKYGKKAKIIMANGFQDEGIILSHDRRVIITANDVGDMQMIYKNNIATIRPYK